MTEEYCGPAVLALANSGRDPHTTSVAYRLAQVRINWSEDVARPAFYVPDFSCESRPRQRHDAESSEAIFHITVAPTNSIPGNRDE